MWAVGCIVLSCSGQPWQQLVILAVLLYQISRWMRLSRAGVWGGDLTPV